MYRYNITSKFLFVYLHRILKHYNMNLRIKEVIKEKGMTITELAEKMGIPPNYQGFGTTLALWGVPSGPYLVAPFLGPSNVRDFTGTVANIAFDPFTYVSYQNDKIDVTRAFFTADVLEALAGYENSLDLLDEGRKSALDFYVYMRSMYQQYRKKAIENAKGEKTDGDEKAAYEFSLDDEFDE